MAKKKTGKRGPRLIHFELAGDDFALDAKGNAQWVIPAQDENGNVIPDQWECAGLEMNAAQIAALAAKATALRGLAELNDTTETGNSIGIEKDGDVNIGCKYIPYEQVRRLARLSAKLAGARKRK